MFDETTKQLNYCISQSRLYIAITEPNIIDQTYFIKSQIKRAAIINFQDE